MSSTILFLVSVLAVAASLTVTKDHSKQENSDQRPSCHLFTQGLTFNDSQALGTWYLLHLKRETIKGQEDSRCVKFSTVNNEDKKRLSNLYGQYVKDLNWDNLTLKMQMPCPNANTNDTKEFFLERIEGDGSYRTLQTPPPTANLRQTGYNRNIMRLKLIKGQYLGIIDCHLMLVFLLGKEPPRGAELDDSLKKIIDIYWPEQH